MCFTLQWLQAVIVWCIVAFAVVALLRLLISAVAGAPYSLWPTWPTAGAPVGGGAGLFVAALNIIVWAIIMIAIVYFIFMLIGCLIGFAGPLPRLR